MSPFEYVSVLISIIYGLGMVGSLYSPFNLFLEFTDVPVCGTPSDLTFHPGKPVVPTEVVKKRNEPEGILFCYLQQILFVDNLIGCPGYHSEYISGRV
jgi:hypothetical protein